MIKTLLRSFLIGSTFLCGFSASVLAQEGAGWLDKERFQIRARTVAILADGDGEVKEDTDLKTDVGDAVTPELDITYFWNDHIAMELIAATAQHSVSANSLDVGETWILPPTLTLQYHFQRGSAFSPYVGAGINYSYFYNEDAGNGFNNLDVTGGFGWAVQAGFDYWLNDNWGLNLDAKYVDLEIDVDVNSGSTALNADDVDLDPFILGAGVSYRF